jgi:hypothetical protein
MFFFVLEDDSLAVFNMVSQKEVKDQRIKAITALPLAAQQQPILKQMKPNHRPTSHPLIKKHALGKRLPLHPQFTNIHISDQSSFKLLQLHQEALVG